MAEKLSIYHRYWIYSKNEAERMQKVGKSMSGRQTELGKVFNNGVMKSYTSIVSNLSQVKEPDAIVVMQGDIRHVNYRQPNIY